MPVHDWTRVDDCLFHDFYLGWTVELCRRLNHDALLSSHFAMSETIDLRPPVGFLVLPEPDRLFCVPESRAVQLPAGECPPRMQLTVKQDRIEYALPVAKQ